MIRYVQAAADDPIVLGVTEQACSHYLSGLEWSARMNGQSLEGVDPGKSCIEAIDRYCRDHFAYVNDPPNIEVIQTPRRMIQQTRVPPDVIRHVLGPCLEAMREVAGSELVDGYQPPPICFGDCDEGGTLFNGMCAACRMAQIRPLLFQFGGHDGTIHHVWSRVGIGDRFIDSDLTEPDYQLGDYSKFPHYENVEVSLENADLEKLRNLGTGLGIKEVRPEEEREGVSDDIRGMAEKVANGRKDPLLVDCARVVGVHHAKMVEFFSAAEGSPVSSHNNKTLFLDAIDLWCRRHFSTYGRSGPRTEDPKEVIAHIMRPYYEAMELDDPAEYRMGPQDPPPSYVGSPEDATCTALALCACLDVAPIRFAFGMRDDQPERMWGRVQADRKWYDTDVNEPDFVLGDRPDYSKVEEVEVPL